MKHATAAEKRAVRDADMTAEQAIVCDDDAVSDFAVVAEMRAGHQKIFVADFRRASFGAAAMNRAILANDIVVSNGDIRFAFGRKGKVLRRGADNGAVPDKVTRSDCHLRLDHRV